VLRTAAKLASQPTSSAFLAEQVSPPLEQTLQTQGLAVLPQNRAPIRVQIQPGPTVSLLP
jgi:hypothetical protein